MFRRRRDALLCAATLAAGGYASYSLYKSQSFQRRKKQLSLLLDGLCKLGETASNVADSTSLLSNDLKTFLQSEDDEVPQSIKQVLKLLQCPECQELIVAASSRVCKGIMYSISSGSWSSRDERGKALAGKIRLHGSHAERHVKPAEASESSGDGWKTDRVDKRILHSGVFNVQGSPSRSRATGKSRHEGLPERLLTKVFSDAGKGFTSAVVGSAVRNLVLSVFEQMQKSQLEAYNSDSESDRDLVPETFELGADGLVSTPVRSDSQKPGKPAGWSESWKPQNLLDLACSSKGKMLVAECIQLFVQTAVSAYLDKTQDVNVFEELVVAVTKPTHQAPVKDMIVTVCNGAVDTLVRTSYEVLYEGSSRQVPAERAEISIGEHSTAERAETNDSGGASELSPDLRALALGKNVSSSRPPPDGVQNLVERMSTAIAIPSNRKLIIDVAGTMTSEAVRSFFDVIITVCTPYLRMSRERVHSSSVAFVGRQIRREAVTKALIVMTVCLAVILHVVANTGLISK